MGKLFGFGDDDDNVTQSATQEVVEEKADLRNLRSALYETEGGVFGEEIGEGGVKKRNTFFGN